MYIVLVALYRMFLGLKINLFGQSLIVYFGDLMLTNTVTKQYTNTNTV